ncbi:MAG: hypothetical protein HRU33_23840 [Rhodobacteraceae bacterium]|nr:hypothetical protein [Paracoccaceae bacterium]
MDLSKLAEHVRTTHFAIVVVSVTILIVAQTRIASPPYDALNELLIVEKLSKDWTPGDLEALALDAYADRHGVKPTQKISGTATLYPEGDDTETPGWFFDDPIESLGYPETVQFSASAVSLLSDSLLSKWEELSNETLSTGRYAPPRAPYEEKIEDGPYYHTPHRMVEFPRPSSLLDFGDFWNVLSLDHSLQTVEPSQSDIAGVFSMTKFVWFAVGGASVQFHLNEPGGVETEEEETAAYSLWTLAGGLQNRGSAFESLQSAIPTDLTDSDDSGFHLRGDISKYVGELETSSNMILHLSPQKDFVAMVTLGIGWMDAWDGTHPAKDYSVFTQVLIPIGTKTTPFDAQRLVLARLPLGTLHETSIAPGSFAESFPALETYHKQYGTMPYAEMDTLIRQQLEQGERAAAVSLFGLSIPIGLLSLFGGAFVFFAQTYHYLHADQLFRRLDTTGKDNAVWGVPWVGLYLDRVLARTTVMLTAVVFPAGAVAYTFASLALDGEWIALVTLPVALMSLSTLQLYSQFWRRLR